MNFKDRLTSVSIEINKAGELASQIASKIQQEGFKRFAKDGLTESNEIITTADFESQRIIIEHLNRCFPNIAVIAEEQESHDISPTEFFAIDPIDGTQCFSEGERGWGTIIGYICDRKPVAGVLWSPDQHGNARGQLEAGSLLNGSKLFFAKEGGKSVAVPFGAWTPPILKEEILPQLERAGYSIIKTRSVVDAVFQLLLGNASIYIGGAEKIWDIAGCASIVLEAGGLVRTWTGDIPSWNQILMPTLCARSNYHMDFIVNILQGRQSNHSSQSSR